MALLPATVPCDVLLDFSIQVALGYAGWPWLSTAPDGNGGTQVVPFEVGKIHCCPIVLRPVTRATRECVFLLSGNFSETSLLRCTPQARNCFSCPDLGPKKELRDSERHFKG